MNLISFFTKYILIDWGISVVFLNYMIKMKNWSYHVTVNTWTWSPSCTVFYLNGIMTHVTIVYYIFGRSPKHALSFLNLTFKWFTWVVTYLGIIDNVQTHLWINVPIHMIHDTASFLNALKSCLICSSNSWNWTEMWVDIYVWICRYFI
jgi:hypothetical protein